MAEIHHFKRLSGPLDHFYVDVCSLQPHPRWGKDISRHIKAWFDGKRADPDGRPGRGGLGGPYKTTLKPTTNSCQKCRLLMAFVYFFLTFAANSESENGCSMLQHCTGFCYSSGMARIGIALSARALQLMQPTRPWQLFLSKCSNISNITFTHLLIFAVPVGDCKV